MATKSEKMYGNSPKLKRGEDGDVGIEKPSEADAEDMGTEGNPIEGASQGMPVPVHQAHERHEMHHRHVSEKLQMHRRHEMEHASGAADTKKHEAEHKEMVDRHHAEFAAMNKRHGSKKE